MPRMFSLSPSPHLVPPQGKPPSPMPSKVRSLLQGSQTTARCPSLFRCPQVSVLGLPGKHPKVEPCGFDLGCTLPWALSCTLPLAQGGSIAAA